MADIKINLTGCNDDDDDGRRGKRGHRGHRGHRGDDGPAGPPGDAATTGGSLLKFAGVVAPAVEGLGVSFLEDWGVGLGSPAIIDVAPSYPFAVAHGVLNFSTNLILGLVAPLGTIVVDLVKNLTTVPVVIATVTYVTGENGIRNITFGPEPFAIGETIDVRISAIGIVGNGHSVSATVGIE